ncbi:Aste57867_14165 [Aphanomyces stellatus]|uniref:Aste57867_14165 protein n=1 Tax=Aphanomyces stellatus TaxID=120398 RepID=A0A485L0K7_9STRA|nr:hypothetical protein As57867_014114 [Aphanomyces stellatus]VFT90990.1 Aste57867_14165 [Aphanomyces stellatus]
MGQFMSALFFESDDTPSKTFEAIVDKYETFDELRLALRHAGLESSSLVLAIDYTKSNEVRPLHYFLNKTVVQWSGERTFGGKCLHTITPNVVNPYQSVIHIMGHTLEAFDDDKLIPALVFGDIKTGASGCYLLGGTPCQGFAQVLQRYAELTPSIQLSGPTNFAPVIRETIDIVKRTREYHILVIVADGQVSNERETRDAIVEASNYAISIIMVGVGDGPWDMMEEFDDGLPRRQFDNFQFVEYNRLLRLNPRAPEVGFATAALMEVPDQFKAIRRLGLL